MPDQASIHHESWAMTWHSWPPWGEWADNLPYLEPLQISCIDMKYRLFKNRIWTSFCVLETFSTNGGGCDPCDRKNLWKNRSFDFLFHLILSFWP
jgi:hypothetical protein